MNAKPVPSRLDITDLTDTARYGTSRIVSRGSGLLSLLVTRSQDLPSFLAKLLRNSGKRSVLALATESSFNGIASTTRVTTRQYSENRGLRYAPSRITSSSRGGFHLWCSLSHQTRRYISPDS